MHERRRLAGPLAAVARKSGGPLAKSAAKPRDFKGLIEQGEDTVKQDRKG
jgi:hypothetical protein